MNIAKLTVNTKSFSAVSRKCWMPKCRIGINDREGTFLPAFYRSCVFPGVEIHGSRWSGSPAQNESLYMFQLQRYQSFERLICFYLPKELQEAFLTLITLPLLRNNSSYADSYVNINLSFTLAGFIYFWQCWH